jgi:uncharacterized protein YunC (DUF1805 family)
MELIVKNIKVKNITVKACQLKWRNSWLFLVDAPKGTITCGSFDIDALNDFKLPAAKVFPNLGEESHSIEGFMTRKITHVNELVSELGVKKGQTIMEAIEKLS